MRKSVPFILSALLAASLGSAGFANGSLPKLQRDWSRFPAIVEIETDEDVYAVGDAHADYDRLVNLLAALKLISAATSDPETVDWTGGKSVLVITGDMIDKWKHSLKVIALVRKLEKDAATKGGRVIATMGNHEAEFLANPNGNKTVEFANELKSAGLKPSQVGNCEGDIGEFLCQLPIAVRVNDWFFCHAGNTNDRTTPEIAAAIEKGFQKKGFATKELVGDASILEARLNRKGGPNGLPWFYGGDAKTSPKKLLASYATKLKVKHLVQGHQPGTVKFLDGKTRHKETLFQRYGLLFLIDSGMSRGIVGSKSIGGGLWIVRKPKETATVICADGSKNVLWDSETEPKIGVSKCH